MDRQCPPGYEKKFDEFIKLCGESKANGIPNVIVPYPWTLGDNYDELIESLSRLAEPGLALHITTSRAPSPSPN